MVTTEQTVEVIEAVSNAIHSTPQQQEPWWQVFAIVGGTLATLIPAYIGWLKFKKGKE